MPEVFKQEAVAPPAEAGLSGHLGTVKEKPHTAASVCSRTSPCCVLILDLLQDVQPCEIEGEYKQIG
jgi:hypothetical protein